MDGNITGGNFRGEFSRGESLMNGNFPWIGALCWHCLTYSIGPNNKIIVRILFAFNSCYVMLIEWTFYYFFIWFFALCKCMSIPVHVNGTVQFILVLIVRLNNTIVTSCDSLIVILEPKSFHY